MKEQQGFLFKRIAAGVVIAGVLLAALFLLNPGYSIIHLLLYESLPGYQLSNTPLYSMFKFFDDTETVLANGDSQHIYDFSDPEQQNDADTALLSQNSNLVSRANVVYQTENSGYAGGIITNEHLGDFSIEMLADTEYFQKRFYTVENATMFTADDFNAKRFLATDLTITPDNAAPKVLIFHTHAYEGYSDSNPDDLNDGVIGVGDALALELTNAYGLSTLHITTRADLVDGKVLTEGAYERMEPVIRKALEEYPSIEVVIDLHRDGVGQNVRLVNDIGGKPTAQLMFVNGICKIREDGALRTIASLPNKYLPENLAFSFNAQLNANQLYPGLMRKIYIKPYRFNLHMAAKSLLIEVGAQTNTMEEAFNTVKPLARILASVLLERRE